MRFNRKGNSIIEVMVVIIILTAGLIGAYNILSNGQKLAITSENRIKAINIAREGIEAVENIRDTNWLKFSSDYTNCWKTRNYNPSCIGDASWNTSANIMSGSYILLNDGYKWVLSGSTVPSTPYDATYRTAYKVYFDANGLVSQNETFTDTCTGFKSTSCLTKFTREISISNPDADHMKINSVVKWVDNTRTDVPHTINLEVTLSNWKRKL